MKKLVLLLIALQLGGCCLVDACAARNKPKVAPQESADKPLPSLEEKSSQL